MALVLVGLGLGFRLRPEQMFHLLTPDVFWAKVAWPLLKSLLAIGVSLFVAMIVEAAGWSHVLGRLASPLVRRANLPPVASASFTAALVSGLTANTMLSEAWSKGELKRRELVLANLLNVSWPSFINHLPSTLMITVSLAGLAGSLYVGLMFAAATLRLALTVILGRLLLPSRPLESAKTPQPRIGLKKALAQTKSRFAFRALKLVKIVIPIYIVLAVVTQAGLFVWLRDVTSSSLPNFFLPVEAASLVVFSLAAEFAAGFAAAGALLQSSSLTPVEAASALVLGSIISTPLRAMRFQLPTYLGLFSASTGMLLIVVSQSFRALSLVFCLTLFWFGAR